MEKKIADYAETFDFVEKVFVRDNKEGYELIINFEGLLTEEKTKEIIESFKKMFCSHRIYFYKSEVDFKNGKSVLELNCVKKADWEIFYN